MLEWFGLLNRIESVNLQPEDATRRPAFDMAVLQEEDAFQHFIAAIEWVIQRIEAA